MKEKFPKNFLWGASSSAFQIEGGWNADGKSMSFADFNSFKKSAIQADSRIASNFYHQWKRDIELMQELGMKAYRFSIAWSRIIPDGDGAVNARGIAFYNKVIDKLLQCGITPMVTLNHFDLPYDLVKKYNGWESRQCTAAFAKYAEVCFREFGDRVKIWQPHNEQNLMMRVNERMNINETDTYLADKMRAQMDYHMFIAHALSVQLCHDKVKNAKIGPAISATVTYPYTNKPEDVWAARMNNYFKTDYALDMYYNGRYSGLYMDYLEQKQLVPQMEAGDEEVIKKNPMDFIAVNYYRTLCARYLPADAIHAKGDRGGNEIDYDQYGYWKIEKNTNLTATEYGAQIDPVGLRIALNEYYGRYHLPLFITENGLGTDDVLTQDGKVHDDYRIDYLRQHIEACALAIQDGVDLRGYCPWSAIDLLSSHQGFKKRYGFVYVNRTDHDLKDMSRIKKDSFYWYQNVIRKNGRSLE